MSDERPTSGFQEYATDPRAVVDLAMFTDPARVRVMAEVLAGLSRHTLDLYLDHGHDARQLDWHRLYASMGVALTGYAERLEQGAAAKGEAFAEEVETWAREL